MVLYTSAMDESASMLRTDDDVSPAPVLASAKAHASVFLPALVIAVLYGGIWLFIVALGKGDGALARLMVLICVIGVPAVFLHAFLRFMSTSADLTERTLVINRGWPRRRTVTLDLRDVVDVQTRQTVLGRVLGVGTLIVRNSKGSRYRINDLAAPILFMRAVLQVQAELKAVS